MTSTYGSFHLMKSSMNIPLIQALEKGLGKEKVLSNELVKERYSHIWRMDTPLQAQAITFPQNTQEVSLIMKACHEARQPVVVHGGLSNLVGSTETQAEELVISMEKMNRIEEVDAESRTLSLQAGVILEEAQRAATEHGLLLPLTYGAKGSAQIGGAISTNAGGLQVFRFGMTRNLVLGLEAVLADGSIISSMKKVIKDNSGYDLKQLFIGSEGTLGIVTRAVLKLIEAPKSRNTAFAACNSYEEVVQLLKFMDQNLGGSLSTFEVIWGHSYEALTSESTPFSPPIPVGFPFYVLMESLGSQAERDQEYFFSLLEQALEDQLISDAAPALTDRETQNFWAIREGVDILVSFCTIDQHYDVSMPTPLIGKYVEQVRKEMPKIVGVEQVFSFGHIADGNVHLIVGKAHGDPALTKAINEVAYSPLKELGGSVSAEHGIGLDKKPYLSYCRSEEEIQLMRTLKQALDPHKLLNRGKVLD